MKRRLAIAAALLSAAAMLPGAALALTYAPPSFDLAADPGASVSGEIAVRNETDATVTVSARAVNFAAKPGDETSGIPEFYPADETRDGRELATWIALPQDVTLLPGERGNMPFTVAAPSDAQPGSHFGAIVLSQKGPNGQGGVGVIGESVSLVLLKVSGDAKEDLKLASFVALPPTADAPPVRFEARFENDGNVHERPYGEVVIRNLFGKVVATLAINRADNKSVLPGAARRFDAAWNGRAPDGASALAREWANFAFGPYTATLTMRYGDPERTATATAAFWMLPWRALLALLLGAAALLLGLKRFFRWYRKRLIATHAQARKQE